MADTKRGVNVYFTPIDSYHETRAISDGAGNIFRRLLEEENLDLDTSVALKVHFGEKKNVTFIGAENYEGIIGYLKENQVVSWFIETNVLYRGERTTRDRHVTLAREHGFTALPIIIADGEVGDDVTEVAIDGKHFTTCKIGKEFDRFKQMIVLSHFKGHLFAGFGGAIKQLAMGCAARGGKLEQHSNTKPFINPISCKKCGACARHCPVDAIKVGFWSRIKKAVCVGCASCIAVCPKGSIMFNPLASISKTFLEKLAEYALAAHQGRRNIYITFAFNMTRGCDCEGHRMKPVTKDLGLLASTDPVAIDQACLDLLDKREGKKVFRRGRYTLEYAEQIGLGSRSYTLVEPAS